MILMLQVKTTMITAPNYAHLREESTVEVPERVKFKFQIIIRMLHRHWMSQK